jgi:hypothetical protein
MPDGEVRPQKRTSLIDINRDNFGFAQWVAANEEFWKTHTMPEFPVTVFGEWCGQGIQKSVALSKMDRKVFAIFAIQVQEDLFVDPDFITAFFDGEDGWPEGTYVLPWHGPEFELNMYTVKDTDLDAIRKDVDDVEECDPWVKEVFGIEGTGEGLVYYPISAEGHTNTDLIDREFYSKFAFKAKGEKHQVNKQTQTVQLAPELVTAMTQLVDNFATENRFLQGVQEACKGEYDKRLIGPFIGWVYKDVHKEAVSELEANGYDWKPVSRILGNKARLWYMEAMYAKEGIGAV